MDTIIRISFNYEVTNAKKVFIVVPKASKQIGKVTDSTTPKNNFYHLVSNI